MTAMNRLFRMAKVEELDKQEQASGAEAFAALLYQYRAELNGWLLVAIWLMSTIVPRAIEFFERRQKDAEAKKAGLIASGETVSPKIPLPQKAA